MRFGPGQQLIAIGALHQLVGVVFGRELLLAIARDGLIGAVLPDMGRAAIFWSLWFGWMLLLLGGAVAALERRGPVPRWLALGIAAMAVGGGALIPASGFWLALIPVAGMLRRSSAAEAPELSPPAS